MINRKEEERNEKIIRGLMKLPPNRRCINCNSLGPQYVCTNFWTFVCIACSGIHREFTHRVKSVSMSKFTSQEVEALQRGGNQRARETLLKDWDLQRQRLPDSSNVDRVREFIKSVYVDRRYAGGKVPDKPPRDTQNLKNHEDDTRRASSYHSYSQSPPYEYQYEERKYGKQVGVLSRKPGSDRGNYEGKISSFVYSPGRLGEQMYEDRFANEGSVSRVSDYLASSFGDPSKSATQSPNFQDKLSSPPGHPVRDILVEDARRQTISMYSEANVKKDADGVARTQRNASLGSFGSFDSNSVSVNSVNSGSLLDLVSEPEQSAGSRSNGTVPVSLVSQSSFSANVVGSDPFGLQLVQQSAASSAPSVDFFKTPQISPAPSIDLFADITPQHVAAPPLVQKPSTVAFPENQGWATFDLPQHEASISQMKNVPPASKARVDVDSLANANMQWASVSYTPQWPFLPVDNQWHGGSYGVQASSAQTNQSWNAFGDTHGSLPQVPYENLPYMNKLQATEYQHPSNSVQKHPAATDQYLSSNVSEGAMPALAADRISSNPFDLPYDSQLEVGSAFLNMSSLQAALPDSQLPPAFVGDFTQPWFPQNTITPYLQTTPQGGMSYMAGDAPVTQLPNIPSQGSVASVGGNPFA